MSCSTASRALFGDRCTTQSLAVEADRHRAGSRGRSCAAACNRSAIINAAGSVFMSLLGPALILHKQSGIITWSALITVQTAGLIIGGALSFKINPKRPLAAACLMAGFQAIPMLVMVTNAPMYFIAYQCSQTQFL